MSEELEQKLRDLKGQKRGLESKREKAGTDMQGIKSRLGESILGGKELMAEDLQKAEAQIAGLDAAINKITNDIKATEQELQDERESESQAKIAELSKRADNLFLGVVGDLRHAIDKISMIEAIGNDTRTARYSGQQLSRPLRNRNTIDEMKKTMVKVLTQMAAFHPGAKETLEDLKKQYK